MNIQDKIGRHDWDSIRTQLHDNGFVTLKDFLTPRECTELINAYPDADLFRKTINMERYRFGKGEYKYYRYPLPSVIASCREAVYPQIAPVANAWMKELQINEQYPATHAEMLARCKVHNQVHPTALILKYGPGGFNTLHQDLYGEVYFPLQMVFILNQAGKDHTGGEFVITEQIPRAQSKANVLRPDLGDMVIFTTNFRPVKGTKGYYRVNMKHGVSPLHSGARYSLGIIFHDALH